MRKTFLLLLMLMVCLCVAMPAFAQGADAPELLEAAEHLTFANEKSPGHLATYNVLSEVLVRLNRKEDARRVLTEGIRRVAGVGEGMGRDLGPAMQRMLDGL